MSNHLYLLSLQNLLLFLSSQVIDYSALKAVRQSEFQGLVATGMCVSRAWLLVAHYNNKSLCVYSLPELQYMDGVNFSSRIYFPRADDAGLVYVSNNRWISVLTVSDMGKVIETRNLTRFAGRLATGPRQGELCVATFDYVVILNVADGSIKYNLSLPADTSYVCNVAVLETGQILVIVNIDYARSLSLALYSSYDRAPEILHDMKPLPDGYGMVGHVNHFLLLFNFVSLITVVDAGGSLVFSIDALNGKDGVWLDGMFDVAIWDNCMWVLSLSFSLVLLCPV